MSNGPLEKAIEAAAEDLPEGWDITLCIEKGAAYIDLYYCGDNMHLLWVDETLAEQIEFCVKYARARMGEVVVEEERRW